MAKSSFGIFSEFNNMSNKIFNSDSGRLFAKSAGNKAAQKFFASQKGGLTKGFNSFKKKNGLM